MTIVIGSKAKTAKDYDDLIKIFNKSDLPKMIELWNSNIKTGKDIKHCKNLMKAAKRTK